MELKGQIEEMYVALKLGSDHLKQMSSMISEERPDIVEAKTLVDAAAQRLEKWIDPQNISIFRKFSP